MNIIADTHTHTIASCHAYSTLFENITVAKKRGLTYLATTDHGPKTPDSDPVWWHFPNMCVIPPIVDGVRVLKGVEANIIDYEGTLDVEEIILVSLDWVIASFHSVSCCSGTTQQHTQAYLRVLENPYVDVIGHCGRPDFACDYDALAYACAKAGKLIEINESSSVVREGSIQNCIEVAKACKKYGTNVVVNTDAHFCTAVGAFDKSIALLQSIDFPQELVVNADATRFEAYLARRQQRVDLAKQTN